MMRLAIAALLLSSTLPAMADDLVEYGRRIAETNCSRCHAVGSTGESHHPEAPPFRDLSKRYPIDALEEAFAEGIVVAHSDMPEFRPTDEQGRALLAYMAAIQSK